ncbi:MAG: choline-sulfatase [Alphaproteobacteria bacterium]|nr:choline-sulfatase [Alphaproteobacteria bacterium]
MTAGASGRPNIVVFMMDQLSALALPFVGAGGPAKAPVMSQLAREGVVFDNAYCNYPLCAPARFAFMAGQLPSTIGAYDNAAEFPASIPTFAHYLRKAGYYTCLSGKMHFIGPDQLHGFEERLTTDIYPADFGWTPSWARQRERATGKKLATEGGVSGIETVTDAGPVARSLQLDYDEEVAHRAVQKVFDLARRPDGRPFLLVVSFTQPHDPFVVTREFWDLYQDSEIPLPRVPATQRQHDPHAQLLNAIYNFDAANADPALVRRARRGYYGMISYADAKIGQIRNALDSAGFGEDTVSWVCSDHGEMLGERGMWFKKAFYEPAMRVPMICHWPGRIAPRRVGTPVSLVDLLPTFVELAGGSDADLVEPVRGRSLGRLARGEAETREPVYGEHFDGGVTAPRFMVRKGAFKLTISDEFPSQLYDVENDPLELRNLAGTADFASVERSLAEVAADTWNMAALSREIEASQRRRQFLIDALGTGKHMSWDYASPEDGGSRYVRRGDLFPDVERRGYLAYRRGGT